MEFQSRMLYIMYNRGQWCVLRPTPTSFRSKTFPSITLPSGLNGLRDHFCSLKEKTKALLPVLYQGNKVLRPAFLERAMMDSILVRAKM